MTLICPETEVEKSVALLAWLLVQLQVSQDCSKVPKPVGMSYQSLRNPVCFTRK